MQKLSKSVEISVEARRRFTRPRGEAMSAVGAKAYCFEGYTLDLRRGCLHSAADEIELRPKSFEVLRYLVENAGRLISKDELISAVWPNVVVADQSLARCVSDVRSALQDAEQRIIKTVPRRGYRFVAPVSSAAATVDKTFLDAGLPPAPRLSIVVLPFANLSADPRQDYFVDGLTEDLTTELSRLGFFVIAHHTALTFKDRSIDVVHVGRELRVRYVLRGSARKVDRRLRVAAQLIDAENGAHLWGDRFDRNLRNLLELQDEITLEIARMLDVQLVAAEGRRSACAPNPDALDLVMRARAILNGGMSRENRNAAIQLCELAMEVAPNEAEVLLVLSLILASNVAEQWSETPEDDLRRAEALAGRVLSAAALDARSHLAIGLVRRLQSRFDDAIGEFEAAIRLNPSMHHAHSQLGWAMLFSGKGEQALPHFAQFIRLSPRDPRLFLGYLGIGWARLLLGDDEGAIDMLRTAVSLSPSYSPAYLGLAAAYGLLDRLDEARSATTAYLRTATPTNTIALVRARATSTHPAFIAQHERLFAGLRKAGLPEE